jgi:hypothetical protein
MILSKLSQPANERVLPASRDLIAVLIISGIIAHLKAARAQQSSARSSTDTYIIKSKIVSYTAVFQTGELRMESRFSTAGK